MRLYAALLYLYPRSFRDEYGAEMAAVFVRALRDARGPAALALWIGTFFDVLWNAALVHGDVLRQDLRYALRGLSRVPGFALTAIAVTALGIGANTAAFSIADFVLVRPLPFVDPDRLVTLWQWNPAARWELSPANYRDWKAAATSFASMGAYNGHAVNIVGQGDPQRVETAAVTADVFSTLGAAPELGRLFSTSDDVAGAPGTAVLSHALWQTHYGGAADVVGKTVAIDGAPFTVIGVLPREFLFPNRDVRLWTTLRFGPTNYEDRNDNYLHVVARLKRGVRLADAQAEMTVIAARLERQFPKENEDVGCLVRSLADEMPSQSRVLLTALAAAAFALLLIACANLASLLLARGLVRRRELTVRSALGAGRDRLVRQLVTESLLLAAVGGGLGVLVARLALPLLARLVPTTLPIAQAPGLDLRVLAFAAVSTLLTGVAFGVFPALRASGDLDLDALREGARAGGGRRERLRAALVTAQVAASVVLLVSSGLLLRSLWRVQATDPGFRPDGVLTVRTALPWPKYEKVAARERFFGQVLSGVRALPGVSAAAYASFLPMAMGGGIFTVGVDGPPKNSASAENASLRFLTPGYFRALGIPFVAGRDVADEDRTGKPLVAVVSESFVKRYWPGKDPIGRRFQVADAERTVVGVVKEVRVRGPERTSEPQVYLPYNQAPDAGLVFYTPKDLAIRVAGDPASVVPAVRRIVHEADPDQPISNVKTLAEIVEDQTASRATQARILIAFAALAVILAGVGLHGLLSFMVGTRSQEIAVRMALGADSTEILRMVMRQAARLAVWGLVPGALLAFAAGRALQAVLFGVTPADALTFSSAIALCAAVTLLGSLFPAIRAARVSPMTAMRAE